MPVRATIEDRMSAYVRAERLPSLGFTMTDAEKGLPVYDEEEERRKPDVFGRGRNLDSVWAECSVVCTRAITDTHEDEDEVTDAPSSRPPSSSFTSPERIVTASVVYCSWLMKCIALVNPMASTISLSEYTIIAVDFNPNPTL